MRLDALLREAWRNLASGTTRGVWWAAVLAVVLGSATVFDAVTVSSIGRSAQMFQDRGGSVLIVESIGAIDGAQCEALASLERVRGAVALRQSAEPLRLAALPSSPPALYEATPGFARFFTTHPSDEGAGIWLSGQLEQSVGELAGSSLIDPSTRVQYAGYFDYPDDGRSMSLAYTAVIEVPATGLFDECWVDVWPQRDDLASLATFAVRTPLDAPPEVRIRQLNTSMGESLDQELELANRVTRLLPLFSTVIAGLVGVVAVRLRRLEIASALHVGVRIRDLAGQLMLECISWAVPAGALALAAAFLIARPLEGGDAVFVWLSAGFTVATGATAVMVGIFGGLASIRSKRFFQFFLDR